MKKILIAVFAIIMMIPVLKADEKVKVYIFEAGGCPYCEAEVDYLKGLDSYNKKFTIVKKELYVDHVDWKNGKDYEIGKKVAEAFQEAGFEDASYEGTPFVVISDLYAAAAYSDDLETFIDAAYEEGDKDVVACIQKGNTDCIRIVADISTSEQGETNSTAGIVIAILSLIAFVVVIVYVIKNKGNK